MPSATEIKNSAPPMWEIGPKFGLDFHKGYKNTCPCCGKSTLSVNEKYVYCFVAGCTLNRKGQDVFNLLISTGKTKDFKAALKLVKDTLGIKTKGSQQYKAIKTRSKILSDAFLIYNNQMQGLAWEFLLSRGYCRAPEHIPFGYANRSLLRECGFSEEDLSLAGLLNKKGGELFYNHIIFPLFDWQGKLVHLQGRSLDPNTKCRWANTTAEKDISISNYLFNQDKATDENLFLTEGLTDGLSLIEVLGPSKVISCIGVHPTLVANILFFKEKKSLTALFDNDRMDIEGKGEVLKSWQGALYSLLKLKIAVPNLEIKCLMPPYQPRLKDTNDWLKRGLNEQVLLREVSDSAKEIFDFVFDEFPLEFELHNLILRYVIKHKDKAIKARLNNLIEKRFSSPVDYLAQATQNHGFYLPS